MAWQGENLKILTDFMNRYGLTTVKLAKATGKNRMTFTQMLTKDDAKISTLQSIFAAFGCVLKITTTDNDETLNFENDEIIIDGIPVKTKQLGFIRTVLQKRGMALSDLAKLTGDSPSAMTKRFEKDDCLMSQLYAMCGALDINTTFTLKRLETAATKEAAR